jgi:hypothetical protein
MNQYTGLHRRYVPLPESFFTARMHLVPVIATPATLIQEIIALSPVTTLGNGRLQRQPHQLLASLAAYQVISLRLRPPRPRQVSRLEQELESEWQFPWQFPWQL